MVLHTTNISNNNFISSFNICRNQNGNINSCFPDQAKYKNVTDWAMSFACIILFRIYNTIYFRSQQCTSRNARNKANKGNNRKWCSKHKLTWDIVSGGATKSWAAFYSLFYIIRYDNSILILLHKTYANSRILIIIAPLITITYSMDKMKDGPSTSIKHMDERIYV